MKKVLVLAAAVALFATPALAGIKNSAHDLSAAGTGTTELCVFCHTPHGATALNNAPLWNRSTAGTSVSTAYNSTTITNATKAVFTTPSSLASTDVPLCLSCHAGTNIQGGLNNEPNGVTFDASGLSIGANANIGVILSNDHPIGMNYSQAVVQDNGALKTVPGTDAVKFFGGVMWCSSCHAVHDDTTTPFLRKANGASALCLTCHNK